MSIGFWLLALSAVTATVYAFQSQIAPPVVKRANGSSAGQRVMQAPPL